MARYGEKGPKKEVGKLAGKFVAIIFWNSQGVLLIQYIPKGVNMISVYYCKVLHELKANDHHKWSDLRNEQIFFMHDNAHSHSSEFMTAFLDELGWFIFLHQAYSPDLIPNDFWLFPCLKDYFGGPVASIL